MRGKLTTRAGLVAVLATLSLSCEETVNYTYFEVSVKIDRATVDQEMLMRFNACSVDVEGPHEDSADLQCIPGTVKYDFGTFDYSTSAKKGSVKFVVTARDLHQVVIARGESQERGIVPNVIIPVNVLVKAVIQPDAGVTPPPPDAGAPDGAPDAEGSDGAPPANASDAPRDTTASDSD